MTESVCDLCKVNDFHFGMISLDREKAFDRVDHNYLFSVLSVSLVKLLCDGAECLLKVGGGLSRQIPVSQGIMQGCSISG